MSKSKIEIYGPLAKRSKNFSLGVAIGYRTRDIGFGLGLWLVVFRIEKMCWLFGHEWDDLYDPEDKYLNKYMCSRCLKFKADARKEGKAMSKECCYTCLNYEDALCIVSDQHDDENPNTFKCDLYDEDIEETKIYS